MTGPADERPRGGLAEQPGRKFRGTPRESFKSPTINPYADVHKAFGDEIIPASRAMELGASLPGVFGRVAPLHVEIGSGNGFYLAGMAARHPELDWVGVEIRFKRVVLAAKKLRLLGLRNARVVRWDAYLVEDLFPAGSLAGLHVNHPDPWPKESEARRRLISPAFVAAAGRLVQPGGELRLKTDFGPHVDALLAAVAGLGAASPFVVVGVTRDVGAEGAPWPDDVRTNYQRKAEERAAPVHAAWLRRADPVGGAERG